MLGCVDHCAWMSSQADSRVAYPGRTLVFLANCYTRNRVIQHSFCAASLACLLRVIRVDFDSFDQLTAPPIPGIKLRPGDRRSVPEATVSNRSKTRLYSITSSARASSVVGTLRASVLAVLRLIASRYFVSACTGRSAVRCLCSAVLAFRVCQTKRARSCHENNCPGPNWTSPKSTCRDTLGCA